MNGLPSHMALMIDLIQQFELEVIHGNRGRVLNLGDGLSQGSGNISNIYHTVPSLGNSR